MQRLLTALLLYVAARGAVPIAAHAQSSRRLFQPDDLFRLVEVAGFEETYGRPYAWSPDETQLVFQLDRSKRGVVDFSHELLSAAALLRSDLWIVPATEGMPRRITDGVADTAGYFAPLWSPRGDRLALLRAKRDNFQLMVWDRATARLTQLTQRGVSARWYSSNPYADLPPMLWISDDELLCPVLADGATQSRLTAVSKGTQELLEAWPRAWIGSESTASVIETQPGPPESVPAGDLLRINVRTGEQAVVLKRTVRGLRLSPDGRHTAFQVETSAFHSAAHHAISVRQEELGFGLGLADRDSGFTGRVVQQLDDVIRLAWAPDSRALAVLARFANSPGSPSRVFVVRPQDGSVTQVTPDGFEAGGIDWSTGSLLIQGRWPPEEREDWWVINPKHELRNVTAHFDHPPDRLVAGGMPGTLLGVADGVLHVVQTATGTIEPYPATSGKEVQSIVWPVLGRGQSTNQLVLNIKVGDQLDTYELALGSGTLSKLTKPRPEAALLDYAPRRRIALFDAETDQGGYLWLADGRRDTNRAIVEANQFLREIAPATSRQIAYRGLDGDSLTAWMLLPPGYVEGRRYPMVTVVYAWVWSDTLPHQFRLIESSFLNFQLLAAKGYVVLWPSASIKPVRKLSDYYLESYLELTKGVLPAIDKAIELGIADSSRLGLFGHSFGGYMTYGLITQSRRFKAAVTMAGWSDLVSYTGQFNAVNRYGSVVNDQLFGASHLESGPWEDLNRYVRNSPLLYVDRVTTPLMIVYGDLDAIPMQQGEEFFTALYRLGRPATFVRYWGEGHILGSPANVRDFWRRVGDWFGKYLGH
jgi:dipeptidyl aminopeptidase/acylaminoacyl peptidase